MGCTVVVSSSPWQLPYPLTPAMAPAGMAKPSLGLWMSWGCTEAAISPLVQEPFCPLLSYPGTGGHLQVLQEGKQDTSILSSQISKPIVYGGGVVSVVHPSYSIGQDQA